VKLLDLDLRAGFLELLLEGLGIVLGDAFLDGLGSGLDKALGLGKTQTGELADDLDDLDLRSGVETGEDDVELGLLLGSSAAAPAAGAAMAAAETPNSSSSAWTSSESSRTVRPLISSIIAVIFSDIVIPLPLPPLPLLLPRRRPSSTSSSPVSTPLRRSSQRAPER